METKHHARFHAAVLRNLFHPTSSPPASPSTSNSPPSDLPILIQQEDGLSAEHVATQISQSEDDENTTSHPSRCQRKKQKIKKLKEKRFEAMHNRSRRFIGPLQPQLQLSSHKESAETGDYFTTDNSEQQKDNLNDSLASAGGQAEVENLVCNGDLLTEKGADFSSRTKRRRLAKKKHLENLPRHSSGSVFTAEVRGTDITIKRIT